MNGFVALVGAGPGNPDLLTLRGKALIEQAQVVVYDRLVSPAILALIPTTTRTINVGKASNQHLVPQAEINTILLQEAQLGNCVVRLKGGDPFIFGRGGEELELLAQHGINFEVVPGITSAIAAPSFAGIPLTHRDFCSSVHIITGHQRENKPLDIAFDALVKTGGTLVFLMGVSALENICKGLLENGMPPKTPAALVENGTCPTQRKLVSTLDALCNKAQEYKIQSPSVIVVGKVCSLSNTYNWFDQLPLKNKPIVVTRPLESGGTLAPALRALGANVLECPCISTDPLPLQLSTNALLSYHWLVFTSKIGVDCFWRTLQAEGLDARALAGHKLAAIGPQTAAALANIGLQADYVPQTYDGMHLGQGIAALCAQGDTLLLLRAADGNSDLPETLRCAGISYKELPLYRTRYLEASEALCAFINQYKSVQVSFTSASTVAGFVRQVPPNLLAHVSGICIGAQTAAAAAKHSIPHIISQQATIPSMVHAFLEGASL